MRTRTAQFKRFMVSLVRGSDKQHLANFNANGIYTFEDVKREADRALKAYHEQGRSLRHPLRAAARAVGNVSAIEAWLTLLPTDSVYTSVACGGLMLLYGVSLNSQSLPLSRRLMIATGGSFREQNQETDR